MNTITSRCTRAIPYLLACLLLVALGGCSKKVSDRSISNIAIADAAKKLDSGGSNTLFVDSRSASEYAERHIKGAVRIDLRDFDQNSPPAVLRRAKEIIVYGNDPGSTTAVALTKRLLRAEFDRVYFMRDGLNGWIARSLPIEP